MDTPILFPDGRLIVRDRLRALMPGVTISTRDFPSNDSRPSAAPYIQVKSDGSLRNARLNGRDTIRFLCYGADDGLTTTLARRAEALILADSGGDLRGCSSQQSTFPTYDPDLGRPMAYFTITARLKPRNLN
jgi:hypothetical protein